MGNSRVPQEPFLAPNPLGGVQLDAPTNMQTTPSEFPSPTGRVQPNQEDARRRSSAPPLALEAFNPVDFAAGPVVYSPCYADLLLVARLVRLPAAGP